MLYPAIFNLCYPEITPSQNLLGFALTIESATLFLPYIIGFVKQKSRGFSARFAQIQIKKYF